MKKLIGRIRAELFLLKWRIKLKFMTYKERDGLIKYLKKFKIGK